MQQAEALALYLDEFTNNSSLALATWSRPSRSSRIPSSPR